MVLSEPIARLLFQHGAFTASDTSATAQALIWLALGLPAHVLVKALSPAFFARHDTLTPLWATCTGVVVAIASALLFGRLFGADGVAAGIALGAWSSALALIRRGAASFGFSIDAAARRRLPRIAVAAFSMGALLWLAQRWVPAPDTDAHGLAQAALLAMLIAGAVAIYGLLLGLFGVTDWRQALSALRQTGPGDLRD
jgi:putative peptidoglycan lipid II flippase